MHNNLTVIYRDDDLVAVHKPAGVKVHRAARDGRQGRSALEMLRDALGQWVYPVHRLDQPTSGVLLFALNRHTASALAAAFARRQVLKTYLAVVRGYLEPGGEIDYPLVGDAYRPKAGQVPKSARTTYQRLATVALDRPVGRYSTCRYTLVQLQPLTGRMHQIRRHLHHISHPVIGDTTYGDGRHNLFFRTHFGCHRLLLAAVALETVHPRTGRRWCVRAPLEASFAAIVRQLGWLKASSVVVSGRTGQQDAQIG
ncbi:MAG: pseudouridylate synthase [Desulfatitalea sp.]|nr:pseudouridylate synthase [Desulfatitalea sp.]